MNFIFKMLIFLSFVSLCQANEMTEDQFEKRGELYYQKGNDTPYTGKVIKRFENGKLEFEVSWKDGLQHGMSVSWRKNGRKHSEANFLNGKHHLQYTYWDEKGQVRGQINFKNGIKDGFSKFWYKNGNRISVEFYEKGLLSIPRTYWYEDGKLKSEKLDFSKLSPEELFEKLRPRSR